MSKKMVNLGIRGSLDLRKRLRRFADDDDRSMQEVFTEAIEEYIRRRTSPLRGTLDLSGLTEIQLDQLRLILYIFDFSDDNLVDDLLLHDLYFLASFIARKNRRGHEQETKEGEKELFVRTAKQANRFAETLSDLLRGAIKQLEQSDRYQAEAPRTGGGMLSPPTASPPPGSQGQKRPQINSA